MRHFFFKISVALVWPVFAPYAGAQTIADTLPVDSAYRKTLDELVVTARRSHSQRFNTPEAIDFSEAKNIRLHQFRTAPELLSDVPGVWVQKTNHGGGSPFIRGLTGNQTLLLIDGIRLNNAAFRYGPNQYFNTIDIFGLQRVEVLRGSGSVQYGSDALGGAIQAFSRDVELSDQPDWGAGLLLRGATQDMEQSAHAGLKYSSRRGAFAGGFSWRNFGDLTGGDTTGRQSPSGYQELDLDLKGTLALTPNTQLTLLHQIVHQGKVPVFHKIQLENFALNQFDPQRRTLTYARLERRIKRGAWQSLNITTSLQQTEEGRSSRKNGSAILREENDRVRSLGFIAQVNNIFGKRWAANSGIEVYHDLVRSDRTDLDQNTGVPDSKRGLYPDGATMTSIAAFSLHEWDLTRWHFTTGVRWNSLIITAVDEAIGNVRIKPSALVGNAAIMRKFATHSRLFASVNTAFRAPNIDDLGTLGIVDFRFETPNYKLAPEHSVNCQIGYKLLTSRVQGEFHLFRNKYAT